MLTEYDGGNMIYQKPKNLHSVLPFISRVNYLKYRCCYLLNKNVTNLFKFLIILCSFVFMYVPQAQANDTSLSLEAIIKIAQHGELRDIKFVQEQINSQVVFDSHDVISKFFNGTLVNNILVYEHFTDLFISSRIIYSIYLNLTPEKYSNNYNLASIRFLDLDRKTCLTLESIKKRIGLDPILGPQAAPPPGSGLPSIKAYYFDIFKNENFSTKLSVVIQASNKSNINFCVSELSINQFSKTS